MKKDFDEFQTRMGFRFPNDVFDILKASEAAGQTLDIMETAAAFSVGMYLLKSYHDWINET